MRFLTIKLDFWADGLEGFSALCNQKGKINEIPAVIVLDT